MSTQQRVDFRDARPDPAIGANANGVRIGGDRLPRPPGRRRPGLALLALLLIVLGGAVAGLLALRIDQRQDVLVARSDIPAGQQIQPGDLAVAKMAADGVLKIPASQTSQVVGRYAATTIRAGRLVDPGMLTTSGLLTSGKAAVGVALKAGRFPSGGLEPGDVVQIVRAAEGVGKTLTSSAVVSSVQLPGDDSLTTSGGDSDQAQRATHQQPRRPPAKNQRRGHPTHQQPRRPPARNERRGRLMPLVVIGSAKAAPGVTTLTVALAALCPGRTVAADLDPEGGDLAIRYRAPDGGPLDPEIGLLSLAVALRGDQAPSRSFRSAGPRPY